MNQKKQNAITLFSLLQHALKELSAHDPLRLAAATAFFTTFALPPILIIVVQVFGLLFNMENLSEQFFEHIAGIVGSESSGTIKRTFLGFKSKAQNWWITIGGFVFLMFVATTLFKVIKDSLNQLWDVKLKHANLKSKLEKRGVSMLVILLAGLLFFAGTMADGLQGTLGEYIKDVAPLTTTVVGQILRRVISVLVVTTWFSLLFKLLPDATLSWKVAIVGGFFTGILFSVGKILIPLFLPFGELTSIFGTSASIVLLLLFVFYSSFILYYGACFTKVYAQHIGKPIQPSVRSILQEGKRESRS